ncbi:hypothetical protein BGZ63DRAFT_370426 [Mariannaea sp. PMI_226]|nr:hypothetical protein BGZ63DRAFT_370426 [Mariannaea sp. PMI_226]
MSTVDNPDFTDNNDGSSSIDARTVAWILIPIVIIVIIGLIATMIQIRRRRQRRENGTSETMTETRRRRRHRPNDIIGATPVVPSNRRVVLFRRGQNNADSETRRAEEGLNELGEAPPPYEGKKSDQEDGIELQDRASGEPSPEYVAEPSPAVIPPSPRPGHVSP